MNRIFEKKTCDGNVRRAVIMLLIIFCISLCFWFYSDPGRKYTFYFQSVDTGSLCVEHRMLQRGEGQDEVAMYVDELLLGPVTERFRPLFSVGTRRTFCFVRNHVLYINLTADALDKTGNASEILVGTELFKENILKTFSNINSIEMYIDNRSIYQYDN